MRTVITLTDEEKLLLMKYWNEEAQHTEQKWLTPDTWGIIYEMASIMKQKSYDSGWNDGQEALEAETINDEL